MRHTALAAAGTLLIALTAVACGNDDAAEPAAASTPTGTTSADSDSPASTPPDPASPSYCALLTEANTEHFGGDDATFDLTAASDAVSALTAVAPAELRSDWQLLDGVIGDFVTVLAGLDLTFDDLDAVLDGTIPEGSDVDPEAAWEALEPVFEAITAPEAVAAQARVQDHARDECDVSLQLGLTGDDR